MYELRTQKPRTEIAIHAASREEMFRDVVAATLEASYGPAKPSDDPSGQVVPVQVAGGTDEQLVNELIRSCLEAVRASRGTLLPPRWMSFDVERVTANLLLSAPSASRPLVPSGPCRLASEGDALTCQALLEES